MKKRIGILTLIAALAALVALPLAARPGMRSQGGPFGGPFFGHLAEMREQLDLTDAQVDRIKTILREAREESGTYRRQLAGGRQEVMTTLLADPHNTAAAEAILDRQAEAENAMKKTILTATSEALGVLTAEQRTKLAQLMGEQRAKRRPR